jgi:aminoglycoside/choline kinase family phosphotransferase
MSPVPLLRTAADVSPDWLTDALIQAGATTPGTRVEGFIAEAIGTGQMADTTRFTLTYAGEDGASGPATVVGKFASADDQSRGTGLALRAYEVEVRFYREVADRVDARVPATYVAEIEPETGWFTLLLQDIVGGTQGDQMAACRPDVAAAVLDEMAGLHAPCWESQELAALDWLNRGSPEANEVLTAMVQMLLPGFLERYADTMAPEHQELCRFLASHMPAYIALRTGPRTASHGDFRLDNLLFQSGDPRPVVVDWQTLIWGSAAADVAYFVGGSVTTEERRRHEADLLVHYHDALRRRGVADYTLEQLRGDFRRETFAGLIMAIVASMVVQRTERGDLMFLTTATRHAQHALDVDAPALLLAAT